MNKLIKLLLAKITVLLIVIVLVNSSCAAQKQNFNSSTSEQQPPSTPATVDSQLSAEWKRYELDGGKGDMISVLLPRQPEDMPGGRFKVAPNIELPLHLYTLSQNANHYFILFVDLPNDAGQTTESQRGDIFEGCWRGLATQIRGILEEKFGGSFEVTSSPQKVKTGEGREKRMQDFSIGSQNGRAQAVFANRRMYMLVSVWNPNDSTGEASAFRFLDSFQVHITNE